MANITIILIHRGLPAGIYEANSPEACHFIADNCRANVIVVENKEQLDKILKVSIVISQNLTLTHGVSWSLMVSHGVYDGVSCCLLVSYNPFCKCTNHTLNTCTQYIFLHLQLPQAQHSSVHITDEAPCHS